MSSSRKQFSIKSMLLGFRNAFNGLRHMFRTEHNAWIHLMCTLLALGLGIWLHISTLEWLILILCIGFVFAAELFNTSLEYLADVVSIEKVEAIGKSKDLAAGAVLVAAMSAVIAGIIIFGPKLWALILLGDLL